MLATRPSVSTPGTPASAHQPEGSKAVTARVWRVREAVHMAAISVPGCSRSEAVQRSWSLMILSLVSRCFLMCSPYFDLQSCFQQFVLLWNTHVILHCELSVDRLYAHYTRLPRPPHWHVSTAQPEHRDCPHRLPRLTKTIHLPPAALERAPTLIDEVSNISIDLMSFWYCYSVLDWRIHTVGLGACDKRHIY
jgi:hypothetical protein